MARSKFYENIKTSVIEKDVEFVYTQGINMYFPNTTVQHPFECDGFIDTKNDLGKMLKLIIEYKFDEDFQTKTVRSKVITQILYYLKRFELNGLILPNVVMVGDINECFVFHTNDIIKYLDEDIDWKIAPSEAHKHNPELIYKLTQDETLNPFIFTIDENFSFKTVADKIKDLSANIQRFVHVTEHNIATIFEYFCKHVIINRSKIQANDLVAIFMGVITKSDNYFKNPNKKNILVTPHGDIKIDGSGFDSFFSYFNRNYTPQEKNRFTEISDRLIEDTNRRNKGEFYTPTLFVDYAHQMISQQLGDDWKEKYVVWDASCGSKNLTRDYYFSELYCSTLEQGEIEIGKHYNPEATTFQYDFLNDDIENLPKGLIEAFEQNKPILFLNNPPYATAAIKKNNSSSKKGVAKTRINEIMLQDNIGASSQNLYTQFMYRIFLIKKKYNLTNCYIGLFSPTLFLVGSSFKKFRNVWLNNFNYSDGCVFQASHFADVASNWGISFTFWNNGESDCKYDFNFKLIDNIDGFIKVIGDKDLYNSDDKNTITAKDWCKDEIKKLKTYDVINLKNALSVKDNNTYGRLFDNAIGYLLNGGSVVEKNNQSVSLFSTAFSNGHGHGINEDNFTKCMALFASRCLVTCNWINSKDEYLKPNTEHPKYKEFENDSIILSLFNTKSNQSSLRQIDYKGKKWDVKNEFFWMSKNEIMVLANNFNNDFCYNDARVSKERFVYNFIQNIELSKEAQDVLNKAIELTKKSFKYRILFNEEHPNYQINNWDCGFYQLKALWKEYFNDDFKEFKELYKKLSDKMEPMVYELGFLRK